MRLFAVVVACLTARVSAIADDAPQSLAEAVKAFNREAQGDAIGKSQPPLTEAEVVAAIRGWIREQTLVSDEIFQAYENIAKGGHLPSGARLQFTTRWIGYKGHDLDVWWVDLLLMTGEKTGYSFRIRDQKISSRPVVAVAPGARADDDRKKVHHFVDLQPYANQKRADNMGRGFPGSSLAALPGGEQRFGGITFKVGNGILQLGSKILDAKPERIAGIKVAAKCSKIHILHATCFGGGPNLPGSELHVKDGTTIGEYRLTFEDKATLAIPIVYGQDVRDWFYVEAEAGPSRGKIAWNGQNERAAEVGAKIRVFQSEWKNTKPDSNVVSIEYVGRKDETPAAPFCVAITFEE